MESFGRLASSFVQEYVMGPLKVAEQLSWMLVPSFTGFSSLTVIIAGSGSTQGERERIHVIIAIVTNVLL